MSKKCTFCGAVLEDEDKFCDECGKKQEDTAAANEPEENIPEKTTTVKPTDYNVPTENTDSQKKGTVKKKHIIPIVIAVILVLLLLSMCGRPSQTPADEETDSNAVSESEEPEESEQPEEADLSQTSIKELLGYIDQTETLVSKAYSDINAIAAKEDTEDNSIDFRKRAEILNVSLSDLSNLQKQADAVTNIDTNLKNAVHEYFSMEYASMNGYYEIWIFMADYLDFMANAIYQKPQEKDYTSTADYYYAFSEWYKSTKEAYSAIDSCPSCMEAEWKHYGQILDLNESISHKITLAHNYKDDLRWQSVRNMSERYDTAESLQYEAFIDRLKGQKEHARRQQNLSSNLAEEIYTYANLDMESRSEYTFENIGAGMMFIGDDSFDVVDTIYPSLYNTYDAFLIIKTGCVSGTKKIVVEAEIPGFTQKYKESFTLNSSYTEIKVKPPALTGDLDLSSAKDAQLMVTISRQEDGTELKSKSFPITIKSKYDFDWYSDAYGISTKDNILCFLTPESSQIAQLKRQAIDEISSMTGGQMESFVGYQNTKWNNHYVGTYLQAAGIMRALYEMGVRYNMKTFSISNSNQHILLPDDVLQQRGGLCIETSLVVASALQSAGMHAFIVLPPGHAQVAVEVWNGTGDDTTGKGEYLLIETTSLSDNWTTAFIEGANALLDYKSPKSGPITYKTQDAWKAYLAVEGTYLIDCDDSRVLGLTPFAN